MERRRRIGWAGGPRPQHASARAACQVLPVASTELPSALLPASRLSSSWRISPSTPIKTTELNRQTRVFRNAVTGRKQRAGTCSNRQKNQIWTYDSLGTASTKVSAIRNAFLAFLPGSAQQVEMAVTHSKQSTAPFLPGSRIASLAHMKSSNIDSKLSEESAWLRL
jgi:hypothetical protein